MTYCLAIRLQEGLLFLGDSRTNAGVDNVSTYRKVHLFQPAPDRFFVLESAGNLATTQEVLDRVNRDLVYPEGNYIRASDDRPFLQIGESKYGKSTLELGVAAHVDLATAAKLALTSMASTAGSNLSVGPPYDMVIYRAGSFQPFEARINADSPFRARLEAVWARHLFDAIAELPAVEEGDLEI